MSNATIETLRAIRVLPILTVASAQEALEITKALTDGGFTGVEVTLRTPQALAAITLIKGALPNVVLAAGTVKTASMAKAARDAGADLLVSPGLTPALIQASTELHVPLVPGVATPSEVLQGMELGLSCFKLFPATAVGGLPLLKALAAPLAEAVFCPTGGINQDNFRDYLALSNVVCVGGSWMLPASLVERRAWNEISRTAREILAAGFARRCVQAGPDL